MSKKTKTKIRLILKGSKDMTDAQVHAFGDAVIQIQKVLNQKKRDEATL